MLVLHDLKLIFVKTRKTGGTSLEMALSKFATKACILTPLTKGDDKIKSQLGLPQSQNWSPEMRKLTAHVQNEGISGRFYNHIPMQRVLACMPDSIRSNYKTCAVHRDALGFLISFFFWGMHQRKLNDQNLLVFEEWLEKQMKYGLKSLRENYEIAPLKGKNATQIVLNYNDLNKQIENSPFLPNELSQLLPSMKAKAGITPVNASREPMDFFIQNNVQSYVENIRDMEESFKLME